MLPASLYTPLYHHVMLLAVFGCALFYWARQGRASSLTQFNQLAMVVIGVGMILFVGFRPVSGVFVDMPGYAGSYERVQQGGASSSNDPLFNGLMRLCGPFLSTEGWFVFCAFMYVAPLALAAWRVHGVWAFPVFLACLTAFSFWAYGVNGIRNGMATSVLLLAFSFHDKPVIMISLMAAAFGIHGSVLLPAAAFLIVRFVRRTEVWLVFWAVCAVTTFAVGRVGEMLLSLYNPFTFDSRAEGYVAGTERSAFRADFLAYSIIPVVATLLLAAPTRARLQRTVSRVMNRPAMRSIGHRTVKTAKKMGIGWGKLSGQRAVSPVRSLALAGIEASGHKPHSVLGATVSTFDPLARQSQATAAQPSTRGRSRASSGQAGSAPLARADQNGWSNLPWVRLLRSDPLYARLVNTYLLSNAAWILVIHATYSNRFAYLSWFMIPWIALYPFVPGRTNGRPRTGLIATVLCAQYLFTYVMGAVIYPLRGMQ